MDDYYRYYRFEEDLNEQIELASEKKTPLQNTVSTLSPTLDQALRRFLRKTWLHWYPEEDREKRSRGYRLLVTHVVVTIRTLKIVIAF